MATLPRSNWDPEGIELDGQRYFAVLGGVPLVFATYQRLLRVRDLATANRTPVGRAQALVIDGIIRDLTRSMTRIGVLAAEDATEAAQQTLEATRKRPDRGSATPLADLIVSRPSKSFPPDGGVGVGDIDTLSKHPGWRVQELGSTHLVEMTSERRVHGLFQPGDSAPDPELSRQHPIFQTGPGPRLIAKHEAPAKAYLRTGAVVAGVKRKQRMDRLDGRLAAEVRSVIAGTHSRLRNAQRALARGGFRRL